MEVCDPSGDFFLLEDLLAEKDIASKRVLVRADLNVTGGEDHARLAHHAKTLQALRGAGAKIGILSHFGRPNGKSQRSLSLAPVAKLLENRMQCPIHFSQDCVGSDAEKQLAGIAEGAMVLFENTRFHEGEKTNDPSFARALAALGDIYVNDAFSVAHRAHASVVGVAGLRPSYMGFAMAKEIRLLEDALSNPKRPAMAIVGGAKIGDKIKTLKHLARKMDVLFVGGAMAHGFLEMRALEIGRSLREEGARALAEDVMAIAEKENCRVLLPQDMVVAKEANESAPKKSVSVHAIPADMMCLDIGAKTLAELRETLKSIQTLFWNGPLGAFEIPPFAAGTMEVARAISERTKAGMVSVAGGGETAAALEMAGHLKNLSHVSMAGGALLEWLAGETLPALAALRRREAPLDRNGKKGG